MAASSIVRNERNGNRPLHEPGQVITAMTQNPYVKFPVMPRPFPVGTWSVGMPRERSSKYLRPFFIPTDAERELPVWALDDAGGYDHVTKETVLDLGYGLHFSESSTTVGCIRVHSEGDLLLLANLIRSSLNRNKPVTLTVGVV
jgi:hypothetical protein